MISYLTLWVLFFAHFLLSLPKLYTLAVGKFMHSYYKKLLPNHFVDIFYSNQLNSFLVGSFHVD